jgi:hypothetical protein
MQRASGWYKRYVKVILVIVGLILAYVFNVDSIAIHRILSKDKGAREQLVNLAIRDNGKYSGEVASIRAEDSTTLSDSILRNTYNMVDNDAKMANSILGLGKPWKDTCEICEDSLNWKSDTPKTFLLRLALTKKEFDSIGKIQESLSYYKQARDQISKSPPVDQKKLSFLDSMVKLKEGMLRTGDAIYIINEYQRMTGLKARCEYIRRKIGKKWFLYSPNQSGGAETLFGWLITALAITLGAPFWFDLLAKLVSLRGAGGNTNTSNDTNAKPNGPSSPGTPIEIHVNTNPGGEAVG